MAKKWQYCNKKSEKDNIEIQKLEENYKISKLLATIMVNRGIYEDKAEVFLNPTRNDFHNPFDMPDMEKAVQRILQAVENNEKTIIYGDYDVDGITSITILKKYLKDRGLECDYYIPNRLKEGYGLNTEAIEKIVKDGYNLIITVDCGITANEEIEMANRLGTDIIITDHHEPGEKIPTEAVAVIDCKRKDNKYPFKELCGAGVAFKLCQAISQKLKLDEKEYLKYLDIACIGTISDIVPLIDENRVITKLGLKLVNCTKNLGLNALLKSIGYNKIDSTAIAFGVAPRINACGRMGNADIAIKLLLCDNLKEAEILVRKTQEYNVKRQSEERKIYEEAINQIKIKKKENEDVFILSGKDWHTGVIGIVSSKITEKYYRPSILIGFNNDDMIGKGSGRSIKGFDLHKALMECKEYLSGFGGHTMAVGVSINKNNLQTFETKLLQIAKQSELSMLIPTLDIDETIIIDDLKKQEVESLSMLEPFGEANSMPIFAFKNLKIDSIRWLSEGKHLRLTLKSNKNTFINAIGFNMEQYTNEFKIGDRIDLAGNLEINSFNGFDSIQINIKDIMQSI